MGNIEFEIRQPSSAKYLRMGGNIASGDRKTPSRLHRSVGVLAAGFIASVFGFGSSGCSNNPPEVPLPISAAAQMEIEQIEKAKEPLYSNIMEAVKNDVGMEYYLPLGLPSNNSEVPVVGSSMQREGYLFLEPLNNISDGKVATDYWRWIMLTEKGGLNVMITERYASDFKTAMISDIGDKDSERRIVLSNDNLVMLKIDQKYQKVGSLSGHGIVPLTDVSTAITNSKVARREIDRIEIEQRMQALQEAQLLSQGIVDSLKDPQLTPTPSSQ